MRVETRSDCDIFEAFSWTHGPLLDLSEDEFPTRFSAFEAEPCELADEGTHLGFLFEGRCELRTAHGCFPLQPGMPFALPGAGRLEGPGRGLLFSRLGWRGLFSIGGPIEERGRLRYIDGCTDSLLIPPVLAGDPCLNLLHIPAGTRQTSHTHPSHRLGLILSGHGRCVTPDGAFPLAPGMPFHIRTGGEHAFWTDAEDLRVLAYHPDSDFGPTHEDHPMINRTIIG